MMNWQEAARDLLLTVLAVPAIVAAVYCVLVLPKKALLTARPVPASDSGAAATVPDTIPAMIMPADDMH